MGGGPTRSGLTPGQLAQIACVLEVSARKPGNVHRHAEFDDAGHLDYVLSAAAIARPLDQADPVLGLGHAILAAVEATRRVAASNTNLGMVLLLAPLARAGLGGDLRRGARRVLEATTVHDARLVYEAIRIARPGGLGRVEAQDVAREPTVTLREAMRLAADRDLVARQYANAFAEVFEVALPPLRASLAGGRPLESAIIAAHLHLLARVGDTLIARKLGPEAAAEASRRAKAVLDLGWPDAPGDPLAGLDSWLRADGHARNPGATADLVAAAVYVALVDGTIPLPIRAGRWAMPSG